MYNLRKLRAKKGLNQEQAAKEIGVSRQQYILYEKDWNKSLTKDKEEKFCELFGVSLVELYAEDNFVHLPQNDEEAMYLMKLLAKRVKNKELLKELWD